jgi:hypothetical protein
MTTAQTVETASASHATETSTSTASETSTSTASETQTVTLRDDAQHLAHALIPADETAYHRASRIGLEQSVLGRAPGRPDHWRAQERATARTQSEARDLGLTLTAEEIAATRAAARVRSETAGERRQARHALSTVGLRYLLANRKAH